MNESYLHVQFFQICCSQWMETGSITSALLMSFHSSSLFGEMDGFDRFGRNYGNDGRENHVTENATKLN